uniref:SCD domain-containing protein n=1 Tax=Anopheles stephensi TaxID=30069 RepID=A0A182YN55_ANOST
MTGFRYTLEDADLLLLGEDALRLLGEKILKASFEERDFLENGVFVANFNQFWQHAIVHQWKDLLHENDWFNKSLMLVMVFCNSECDVCAMVGCFVGTNIVPQLCAARLNLSNDMERVNCWRDNQRKSSLKKKQHYLDQICQVLLPDLKHGLKYAKLSAFAMEKICATITAYPDLMIIEYGQLELIGAGLAWKNRKPVQVALKCLKTLMSDTYSASIREAVGLYVLKTETQLTRIMDSFKVTESAILCLFLEALSIVGSILLCEDTAEKIVRKMFSNDDTVINAAIDLHGIYYASLKRPAELETNALIAILDVFERYAYPLAAYETIIQKLWLKGFFRQFDGLFEMLADAESRANATFIANCTAHTINYCHRLLMDDISSKISPALRPSSDTVNWPFIRKRMESFVSGYPKCLVEAARSPNLYNLLLNCLRPENTELYRVASVDCEAYYEQVLFHILSKVALNGTSYSVLFHTLTTIYSFDTIAHISEDIWNDLTEQYYTVFFHIRTRLRRYNLGIDAKLMESYAAAITRLCVLIEINNTSEHVFTLVEYLENDLRLLKRMNLSNESEAIFYRLYKNALIAGVKWRLEKRPDVKFGPFGKRLQMFMAELTVQLDGGGDQACAVGWHISNALCNMLILTQQTYANVLPDLSNQLTYCVEVEVLQQLAKYIERHVFGGKTVADEDTSCLLERRLMLTTYNAVYRQHQSLPQQTDTCHVLKHYEENGQFAEELEQLLGIVFENNRHEFYSIAAQIVVDYGKKPKHSSRVKKFLSSLHRFQSKCLPEAVDENEYSLAIVQCIVDQILEQVDGVNGIPSSEAGKLFRTLSPWICRMPSESRSKLNRYISNHPNYLTWKKDESSDIRIHLKMFLRTLKTK